MNKEEITETAWNGFMEINGPNILLEIIERNEAKTQDEILAAIWRTGFYYALLCLEKGKINVQNTSSN